MNDIATSTAPAPPDPAPRVDAQALLRLQRRQATADAPWLHREVARRMATRLDLLKLQPQRVVDWWSHGGGGQTHLLDHYAKARHVVVEPAAWLDVSKARSARPWWRALTLGRTIETLPDSTEIAPAELLWSNMMLHWQADLRALLAAWHRTLEVEGMLMFSCLGPDTLATLRQLYRRQGWGEAASAFVDMHDLGDALIEAGFTDPVMDMELITLTWDSPAALLAELRAVGGNTAPSRWAGLRTPRWRAQLEATIAQELGDGDGRVKLGFEIVYGHAIRGIARAPVKSSTEISLQTVREMTRKRSPRATP
jgi:malonyl-CoA O-methyltransferase